MNNKTIIKSYVPAVLWSSFIFFLCFLPGNAIPKEDWLDKIYFDKIVHVALYCILFILMARIPARPTTNTFLVAGILCIAQGVLIESVQGSSLVHHRSFDILDILANTGSVLIAVLFMRLKAKRS